MRVIGARRMNFGKVKSSMKLRSSSKRAWGLSTLVRRKSSSFDMREMVRVVIVRGLTLGMLVMESKSAVAGSVAVTC
jgi:hypothetical protein